MATTSTIQVTGMTCGHCAVAVTEELSALPGVTGVDVDLGSGRVEIRAEAPLDADAVRGAVREAGYEVGP
jgi:copper chaperone